MRPNTTFALDARTAIPHFPGIGRYVRSLGKEILPQLGDDEKLALVLNPGQEDLAGEFGPDKHISIGYAESSNFDIRQQTEIPAHLKKIGAGLYHSPYYMMPYRPGRPCVLTVYDLIPLLFPGHVSARARVLFRWMTILALRSASEIIAISESTGKDLLRYFAVRPDRVAVIPLAAGPQFRPQDQATIERVRHVYGLPESYLLYFGINKPHKNLERLVEAWATVVSHSQETSSANLLVIAGAWDPRYDEPRRRVDALGLTGRVRFIGQVPEADVPALYGGAMAFIFPSLYEGFGLPVVEAMACGVPVACAESSSLTEIARDRALLFNPTSTQAITEALLQLIVDSGLRADLRERGLKRAADYSWGRTATATLEVYRRQSKKSS